MKFDIEEFKKYPERELILRNLADMGPGYWHIEEASITIGDILVIKIPDRNLDFSSHAALNNEFMLKHEVHGNIGILEFANERLTLQQFIQRLIELPTDCSIDFFNNEGYNKAAFGVIKLKRFDSVNLLFCQYGGNHSQCYDATDKIDESDLEDFLKSYLEDHFEEFIFIDATNADKELWGVTFEHTNVDGLTFRRLVTNYPVYPFFTNKAEAENWIKQHVDNDFDEEFGPEFCSNPKPVLIDRWVIDERDKCIQLI